MLQAHEAPVHRLLSRSRLWQRICADRHRGRRVSGATMVSIPRRFPVLVSAVLLFLAVPSAFAQDYRDSRQPSLADAVKAVASDPTTYILAVVSYMDTRLDWYCAQVFFRHGLY